MNRTGHECQHPLKAKSFCWKCKKTDFYVVGKMFGSIEVITDKQPALHRSVGRSVGKAFVSSFLLLTFITWRRIVGHCTGPCLPTPIPDPFITLNYWIDYFLILFQPNFGPISYPKLPRTRPYDESTIWTSTFSCSSFYPHPITQALWA